MNFLIYIYVDNDNYSDQEKKKNTYLHYKKILYLITFLNNISFHLHFQCKSVRK